MELTEDHVVFVQVAAAPKTVWHCKINDETFARVVLHAMKVEEALDEDGRPGQRMVMQADARPFEVWPVDEGGLTYGQRTRCFDRPEALREVVAIGRAMHKRGRFTKFLGAPP